TPAPCFPRASRGRQVPYGVRRAHAVTAERGARAWDDNRTGGHMKSLRALRPTSRLALLIGLVAMIAAGAGPVAAGPHPPIQTTPPTSERQITNIDVLRQQIRNYYGDPLGTGTFSADSNYAKEAADAASDGTRYLDGLARQGHANHAPPMAAILLDVDDTTLA